MLLFRKTIVLYCLLMLLSLSLYSQKKIKPELKPFVNYLEQTKFPTAKDYILQKFESKDIVIISERDHRDMTQYDVIFDVLKDERFKGNIYTEVGCFNNYRIINKWLLNSSLSEEECEQELLAIYRDLDFNVVWEKYNFYVLLKTIYKINKTRLPEDKILLFPLDVSFDWNKVTSPETYLFFDRCMDNLMIDRDLLMGKAFVASFEAAKERNPNRSKALVIENTYHGYIRIPKYLPSPTKPDIYSTGEFIYKTYPQQTTNIYVNYYTQGFRKGLTNNGLFDAAFAYTQTDNIGFDFKDTPFGNAEFDLYNFGGSDYETVNFDYIFDGMIFYKPVSEMQLAIGIPNVYPKELEEQFYKRTALTENISYETAVEENKEYFEEINRVRIFSEEKEILEEIKTQINSWFE